MDVMADCGENKENRGEDIRGDEMDRSTSLRYILNVMNNNIKNNLRKKDKPFLTASQSNLGRVRLNEFHSHRQHSSRAPEGMNVGRILRLAFGSSRERESREDEQIYMGLVGYHEGEVEDKIKVQRGVIKLLVEALRLEEARRYENEKRFESKLLSDAILIDNMVALCDGRRKLSTNRANSNESQRTKR